MNPIPTSLFYLEQIFFCVIIDIHMAVLSCEQDGPPGAVEGTDFCYHAGV